MGEPHKVGRAVLGTLITLLCAFGVLSCVHAVLRLARGPSGALGGLFDYPGWSLAHFVSGAIVLALLPFQMWAGFRSRHRRVHRWSGRVVLTAGVVADASGFALVHLMPSRPIAERAFMTAVSVAFLFFMVRALAAVRNGDLVRHREWVARMAAGGLAPVSQRVLFPLVVAIGGIRNVEQFWEHFMTAAWFAIVINLAVAEWWLNLTRTSRREERASVALLPPGATVADWSPGAEQA